MTKLDDETRQHDLIAKSCRHTDSNRGPLELCGLVAPSDETATALLSKIAAAALEDVNDSSKQQLCQRIFHLEPLFAP